MGVVPKRLGRVRKGFANKIYNNSIVASDVSWFQKPVLQIYRNHGKFLRNLLLSTCSRKTFRQNVAFDLEEYVRGLLTRSTIIRVVSDVCCFQNPVLQIYRNRRLPNSFS